MKVIIFLEVFAISNFGTGAIGSVKWKLYGLLFK